MKVVRKGLENLRATIPKVSRQRLWEAVQWIKKKLSYTQTKPPRRPKQTYIRTFTMLKGYRIGKTAAGGYYFMSTAPYTVYVIGGADGTGQTRIFVDRWPNMRETVEWVIARSVKAIQRGIRLATKNNFKRSS